MKKFIGFLLILALVMSMGVMAFASEGTTTTYQITIDNSAATTVSIAGKTYTAYKLFDVTYAGSEPDDPHAYSIDSDGDGAWAWDTIKGTADANGVYTNSTYGLTFTPTAADPTVYSIESTMTAAQARALADALQSKVSAATAAGTGTAAANTETAVITLTEPGYYVVYGTVTANDPPDGSKELVAALALTTADPTETVVPKVSAPPLDKKITGAHFLDDAGKAAAAEVGKTVDFEIDSSVPDLTGYIDYTYTISDEMTSGLTFTDPEGTATNDIVVKIKNADETNRCTVAVNGKSFTVNIPFAVLSDYSKGDAIVVTYSAVVNEDALNTNYEKNTATLEYSNNPYGTTTNKTPPKDVYVIDVSIDVEKYSNENSYISTAEYNALTDEGKAAYQPAPDPVETGKEYVKATTPLKGAKFKLFKGTTMPADNTAAWYSWDVTNKKVVWTTKANADTFTTTADGNFNPKVQGLEAEKTGTAYGLLEIEAPEGYNQLKEPITFTLTGSYNDGTTGETATITASAGTVTGGTINLSGTQAAQPVVTEPVLNQSGKELPSTGGIGTTIFYIVGGILVVGAGVVLVTRKKTKDD